MALNQETFRGVDVGATYPLSGFRYLTIQDNTDDGNIAKVFLPITNR